MNPRTFRYFIGLFFVFLLTLPFLQTWMPHVLPLPTEILIQESSPVLSPPSSQHWFGTDDRGRDVFSRLIFGLRNSVFYCGGAFILIVSLGYLIGSLLGLSSRRFDFCAQRLIEIWSMLPAIQIALLLTAVFSSAWALFSVWVLFGWVSLSQYVRLEVLRLKKSSFVGSSRNMGASFTKIFLYDILPNSAAPLKAIGPLLFSNLLITLTSLDYLGLGLPPPTPSLGELLSQAKDNLNAWWLLVFPLVSLLGILWGVRRSFMPPHEKSVRISEEKPALPFPKTAITKFPEWVSEH